MDLRNLRYFVVIAECGSILAASEKLHIAQPSLSIRIKALEQELGVMLFDRRPRGVVLTSEGEELVAHARQILQAAQTARESVRQHAKSAVGTVNFGVPTSLASVICVPLVEEILRDFPDVRLRIVESMSGYIIDWLRDGRLDVGLVFGDKSISGIQLDPIIEEDLYLAADSAESLADLLDENDEVPLERLSGLPLILPTGHHGLRQLVDDTARRQGITRVPHIEIDSFSQIQRMVQRQMGVTILSRAALYESPLNPALFSARIVSPAIPRTVCLAYSEQRLQTKATRETARRACGILRDRAASSIWAARLL
ncbi:LysR family transcriptional regulator [Devosia algicola]|uniref:LysR family transcriptional regulator n=1 Tax=Devosia algicola TaxID=3026418 RepID=A0ABY7YQC6_9HYPH|nr:LysR family transcriptional regulator [Devosia algicola]WDR03491.1 LysR family transcriptional regulator [Devosia algicola]